MISVIMGIYKESLLLVEKSVSSILRQTYSVFEFIIVIDNPNLDETVKNYLTEIAKTDDRVILVYNENNIGLAMSLNKGLAIAKGEYIARMDADDISFENRFEKQIDYITKTNSDLVFTNKTTIDEDGRILSQKTNLNKDVCSELLFKNIIVHPSVLMKTVCIKNLGGYRKFRSSQDYDLWLRFLSSGYKISLLDEPLIYYRVSSSNLTNTRRMEQFYLNRYQMKLYKERTKNNNKDSFSEQNVYNFLKKRRITPARNKRCLKCFKYMELAKKKKLLAVFYLFLSFCSMPRVFINCITNGIRKKIYLKRQRKSI